MRSVSLVNASSGSNVATVRGEVARRLDAFWFSRRAYLASGRSQLSVTCVIAMCFKCPMMDTHQWLEYPKGTYACIYVHHRHCTEKNR